MDWSALCFLAQLHQNGGIVAALNFAPIWQQYVQHMTIAQFSQDKKEPLTGEDFSVRFYLHSELTPMRQGAVSPYARVKLCIIAWF